MKLSEAKGYLESLVSETQVKSELKTYNQFVKILNSLHEREFSHEENQSLEKKLEELELKKVTTNTKKHLRKKLHELTTYLVKEFSLVTEGYYTTQFMVLGMTFGTGFGAAFGTAFGNNGIAIGLPIGTGLGMGLGIMIGASKDASAKKEGRVLS